MKIKMKILTGILVGSTIFSSLGGLSYANNYNTWESEGKNWYYYGSEGELYKNRWLLYKNEWYYFGSDGKMLTESFVVYKGKKYYVGKGGEMLVNTVVEGYSINADGEATKRIINAWKSEGKNWYYYGSEGELYKNRWLLYKNEWYYFGSDGKMLTESFVVYKGKKYYVGKGGEMLVNTVVEGYSINADGEATKRIINAWKSEGKNWYYYGSEGELYKNRWLLYKNEWYYFGSDGKMLTESFVDYKGKKYYVGKGGEMLVSTVVEGYSINADGEATKRIINAWEPEGKNWYYYGSEGELYKNRWLLYKNEWYYFGSDGKMLTESFVDYKGKKYYVGKGGEMLVNTVVEGYSINADGEAVKLKALTNSWDIYDGNWYYYGSEGELYKNRWLLYKNEWYYFGSDGKMLTESFVDYNGSRYYLSQSGKMSRGFAKDSNGNVYYFSISDGAMQTNLFAYNKYTGIGYNIGSDGIGVVSSSPRRDFINMVSPYMINAIKGKGLFPSVAIAQTCLETGFGSSTLGYAPVYNLFGIKAPIGAPESEYIAVWTTEYINGNKVDMIDKFKKFRNYEDAFAYYAGLFTKTEWLRNHYRNVISAETPEQACKALTGTYATDPDYGKKLLDIIEEFNLKEFDKQLYRNGVK